MFIPGLVSPETTKSLESSGHQLPLLNSESNPGRDEGLGLDASVFPAPSMSRWLSNAHAQSPCLPLPLPSASWVDFE